MNEYSTTQKDNDFLKDLRAEGRALIEQRNKINIQKLIYATSLIGGSYIIKNYFNGNRPIIYINLFIPYLSFVFDLLIFGVNFRIIRIGEFFRNTGNYGKKSAIMSEIQSSWETCVKNNADPYSRIAGYTLTFLIIIASLLIVIFNLDIRCFIICIWMSITLIIFTSFIFIEKYTLKKLEENIRNHFINQK